VKVLVADDSPVLRAAVAKLLVDAGYEAVTAENGIEAIQRFYADFPDLMLLDIQMPKMNGYVVCRLVKEDWSVAHIPVLILTARDSAEDRYWAQKSGADGYLTKESLGEHLLPAIQSSLASRALSELSRDELSRRALDENEVLSRVCDMLDRKLFEATIVNDITTMGARALDLRTTIEQMLAIVRRFVEYDLAGVLLTAERRLAFRCDRPVSGADLSQFRALAAGHLQQLAGVDLSPEEVGIWRLDDEEILSSSSDAGGWPSFFAMPLRSRGEVLGVLVMGSRRPGTFGETGPRILRMIEYPMAAVLESAQHHQKLIEQEARLSLSSLMEG
jgi:twitching motility two-component system response regulator PilH